MTDADGPWQDCLMTTARQAPKKADQAGPKTPGAGPHLEFDRDAFIATFNKAPMRLRHDLTAHPLLTIERLAELADSLVGRSTAYVEHNFGDIPDIIAPEALQRLDVTPGEVVRGIADNGCWIGLRHVETDPEYRALLEEVLSEVTDLIPEGRVTKMEGFIFVTAPNATTPAHIDPEHNLLLHMTGSKTISVGTYDDAISEQLAVEDFHGRLTHHRDSVPKHMEPFELAPGDGVYVPIHATHVVHNGPVPAISFSMTWNTLRTDKDAAVHKVNHRLRKLGLSPAAPGIHPGRDFVKQAVWRGPRAVKRALRR